MVQETQTYSQMFPSSDHFVPLSPPSCPEHLLVQMGSRQRQVYSVAGQGGSQRRRAARDAGPCPSLLDEASHAAGRILSAMQHTGMNISRNRTRNAALRTSVSDFCYLRYASSFNTAKPLTSPAACMNAVMSCSVACILLRKCSTYCHGGSASDETRLVGS